MSALVVLAALVAGAVGAVARFGTVHAMSRRPERIGWAVAIVNVSGSLVGGVVIGLVQLGAIGADLRLIVLSGFAGGLTTFSTWSAETIQFALSGKVRVAVGSMVINLVLGVGAVLLGLWITLFFAGIGAS